MRSLENPKKEDIDSGMSSESDVGFASYNMPDYSITNIPKIDFNTLYSIDESLDSIKTAILSRHPTYGATTDSVKYSPYEFENIYKQGIDEGMKRAVEPGSPIIEEIVKKAVEKLSKEMLGLTKTGEWIVLRISMEISGTNHIKYTCSNCKHEFSRTTFLRCLPNYCENCGSKNSVRDDSEKVFW